MLRACGADKTGCYGLTTCDKTLLRGFPHLVAKAAFPKPITMLWWEPWPLQWLVDLLCDTDVTAIKPTVRYLH